MPHLTRAGHQVALWHEVDTPIDHELIPVPVAAPVWSASDLGLDTALTALAQWQPDLIYAHGLLDPAVERRVLKIAPSVFFAHNYYGTCISGAKTVRLPSVTPCGRKFGWQCLAHYYPRRCGGLSPISMVRQYRQQRDRLRLLSEYSAIVTHSTHMQKEYVNHGLNTARVFDLINSGECARLSAPDSASSRSTDSPRSEWRLLFAGRMDELKGGRELIHALPEVARRVGRRLRVTFAGDGPQRRQWERLSVRICRAEPEIHVNFIGWADRRALDALFAQSDLLVLPSLWPEPFALVGLEAARHRLPVAAYAVGGIPDWLTSGENGYLAPGDPPTVDGLVQAIVACLRDVTTHDCLREGAARLSAEFAFNKHIELLLGAFADVVATRPTTD